MRRLTITVLLSLAATGITLGQSIVGTAHNVSAGSGTDEVCVFCHTPHAAAPAVPLWNHSLSSGVTYTVYSSATLNSTPTDFSGGTAVSNLCMSCHDGTVGLGSLVNNPSTGVPGNSGTTMPAVPANLGTDLSNDHPVNFVYDNALVTADAGTGPAKLADPAGIDLPLFGAGANEVQCASCHNPHNNNNAPFLVKSNAASALCRTCHLQ